MLILTREPGQSIIINDQILVKFLGYSYHKIRLGIDAPEEMEIVREEILKHRKWIPRKEYLKAMEEE